MGFTVTTAMMMDHRMPLMVAAGAARWRNADRSRSRELGAIPRRPLGFTAQTAASEASEVARRALRRAFFRAFFRRLEVYRGTPLFATTFALLGASLNGLPVSAYELEDMPSTAGSRAPRPLCTRRARLPAAPARLPARCLPARGVR